MINMRRRTTTQREDDPPKTVHQLVAYAVHRSKDAAADIQAAIRGVDVTDMRNWPYIDALLEGSLVKLDVEDMPPVVNTTETAALHELLKEFQREIQGVADLNFFNFWKESDWPKTVTIRKSYVKAMKKIEQVSDKLRGELARDSSNVTVPLSCISFKDQSNNIKEGTNIPNIGKKVSSSSSSQLQIPGSLGNSAQESTTRLSSSHKEN